MPHLLCFGYGYTAGLLSRHLTRQGWQISATCRNDAKGGTIIRDGARAIVYTGLAPLDDITDVLGNVTHVLVSIPPDDQGDLVVRHHSKALINSGSGLEWLGYLSTTGVYGDRNGEWVDETTPNAPTTNRGRRRTKAEAEWRDLANRGVPAHFFRLAGIYGPGRNQLEALKTGRARRIVRPGQMFGRIHVEDIIQILLASMKLPSPGSVYNVCDDEPAPPQDVIAYAADLMNMAPPPEIAFEGADVSEMAKSFYTENKKVANNKIKQELGVNLSYPTYREGLTALMKVFNE
jgi:nucleoside-diphosphate-sugar epimerase